MHKNHKISQSHGTCVSHEFLEMLRFSMTAHCPSLPHHPHIFNPLITSQGCPSQPQIQFQSVQLQNGLLHDTYGFSFKSKHIFSLLKPCTSWSCQNSIKMPKVMGHACPMKFMKITQKPSILICHILITIHMCSQIFSSSQNHHIKHLGKFSLFSLKTTYYL